MYLYASEYKLKIWKMLMKKFPVQLQKIFNLIKIVSLFILE